MGDDLTALNAAVARKVGWRRRVSCVPELLASTGHPDPERFGGFPDEWKRGDVVRHGDPPPYATATPGTDEHAVLCDEMLVWLSATGYVRVQRHADGTACVSTPYYSTLADPRPYALALAEAVAAQPDHCAGVGERVAGAPTDA